MHHCHRESLLLLPLRNLVHPEICPECQANQEQGRSPSLKVLGDFEHGHFGRCREFVAGNNSIEEHARTGIQHIRYMCHHCHICKVTKGSEDSYKMFLSIAQQHDKAKERINFLNGKIELLEEHVNRLETQIQVPRKIAFFIVRQIGAKVQTFRQRSEWCSPIRAGMHPMRMTKLILEILQLRKQLENNPEVTRYAYENMR